MKQWRAPPKKCSVSSCQRTVSFFRAGAEYMHTFCVFHEEFFGNKCQVCGMLTDYAKDWCEGCYTEPCINSCCQNGLAELKILPQDLRNWFWLWKRRFHRLPRDVFRLIALCLKLPARECFWCGPGVWHAQKHMVVKPYDGNVWACKKHKDRFFIMEPTFFCSHSLRTFSLDGVEEHQIYLTRRDQKRLIKKAQEAYKRMDRSAAARQQEQQMACQGCRKKINLSDAVYPFSDKKRAGWAFCSGRCAQKR